MKKRAAFIISLVMLFLLLGKISYAQTPTPEPLSSKEIIVVFKSKPTTVSLLDVAKLSNKVTPDSGIAGSNAVVYKVNEGSVSAALAEVRTNPSVAAAFPNRKFRLMTIPNDELIVATPIQGRPRVQWNMFNLKLAGEGRSAWDVSNGAACTTPTVAVIDSGVDPSHPDLSGKIASLVDCTGESCRSVSSMTDEVGHGTHVAGLIGAATNNNIGMASAGFNAKIMAIKVMDAAGAIQFNYLVNAIRWAADHGAQVINLSLGDLEQNLEPAAISEMNNAAAYAWGKGVVVVASAGNCAGNTNGQLECAIVDAENNIVGYAANPKIYPAASPNVISVAALTVSNNLVSYSEHNDSQIGNWVSVAAPGGQCSSESDKYNCIVSTKPGNQYGYLAGSSMAAPQVAGVAALMFALNPQILNSEVKNIIETTADKTIAAGSTNNGAVDALAAVSAVVPSASCALAPSPTQAASPSATPYPIFPTVSYPASTPIPTVAPRLPKALPSPLPSPPFCPDIRDCSKKPLGDANCDYKIDEKDCRMLFSQYDTMPYGVPPNQNANFSCIEGNPNTYIVGMADYEIGRRNGCFGIPEATPGATLTPTVPTSIPTVPPEVYCPAVTADDLVANWIPLQNTNEFTIALTWVPGSFGSKQQLFIGTDYTQVMNGCVAGADSSCVVKEGNLPISQKTYSGGQFNKDLIYFIYLATYNSDYQCKKGIIVAGKPGAPVATLTPTPTRVPAAGVQSPGVGGVIPTAVPGGPQEPGDRGGGEGPVGTTFNTAKEAWDECVKSYSTPGRCSELTGYNPPGPITYDTSEDAYRGCLAEGGSSGRCSELTGYSPPVQGYPNARSGSPDEGDEKNRVGASADGREGVGASAGIGAEAGVNLGVPSGGVIPDATGRAVDAVIDKVVPEPVQQVAGAAIDAVEAGVSIVTDKVVDFFVPEPVQKVVDTVVDNVQAGASIIIDKVIDIAVPEPVQKIFDWLF